MCANSACQLTLGVTTGPAVATETIPREIEHVGINYAVDSENNSLHGVGEGGGREERGARRIIRPDCRRTVSICLAVWSASWKPVRYRKQRLSPTSLYIDLRSNDFSARRILSRALTGETNGRDERFTLLTKYIKPHFASEALQV